MGAELWHVVGQNKTSSPDDFSDEKLNSLKAHFFSWPFKAE